MPGKFEGEPEWVRELWQLSMHGFQDATYIDRDGDEYTYFFTPEDEHVLLWEDNLGFVHHRKSAMWPEIEAFLTQRGVDI